MRKMGDTAKSSMLSYGKSPVKRTVKLNSTAFQETSDAVKSGSYR